MTRHTILALFLSAAAMPALSQAPAAPEAGGPRAFVVTVTAGTLNLREAAAATAPVVARLANGARLSNLGCADTANRVWCDVQPIEGGPRGFAALDYLTPAVGPDGAVPSGPDDSALRAGQGQFDATGPALPCATAAAQPMGQCNFGVARSGGGYATVIITLPDGRSRTIYFALGQAIGAGFSEADPTGDFSATRVDGLTTIRLGDERYEIPDAVPLGG
jgi:hypothetical protein